jgi:ketosteroid isomerase-like protein
MASHDQDDVRQQIWKTVRELNDCWTKRDGTELVRYFHPRMVAIVPASRERLVGRDACVAGWVAFAKLAAIRSWKEIDPQIEVFDNAAVVTYYFDLRFEMNGQTIQMTGRDMFTLVREDDRWWAVADQFSPNP